MSLEEEFRLLERRVSRLERLILSPPSQTSEHSTSDAQHELFLASDPRIIIAGGHAVEHDGDGRVFRWLSTASPIQIRWLEKAWPGHFITIIVANPLNIDLDELKITLGDDIADHRQDRTIDGILHLKISNGQRSTFDIGLHGLNRAARLHKPANDDPRDLSLMLYGIQCE